MKKLLNIISFIPVTLLSLTYATHGAMGLILYDEHIQFFLALGFGEPNTSILVVFWMLLSPFSCYSKTRFRRHYAGSIYSSMQAYGPLVPKVLEWYGGSTLLDGSVGLRCDCDPVILLTSQTFLKSIEIVSIERLGV